MIVGYARTSTVEQVAGLEAQVRDLEAVGATKIFAERVSSVSKRPQLDQALEFVREGDVLVVSKLDRLARSVEDLVRIVRSLADKGVSLKILQIALDTATPTGKLMVNMLGSVAQFEREIMLERQREGIAKAKTEGKYKGRKPTAMAKSAAVLEFASQGISKAEIAKRLGLSQRSVFRILAGSAENGRDKPQKRQAA